MELVEEGSGSAPGLVLGDCHALQTLKVRAAAMAAVYGIRNSCNVCDLVKTPFSVFSIESFKMEQL